MDKSKQKAALSAFYPLDSIILQWHRIKINYFDSSMSLHQVVIADFVRCKTNINKHYERKVISYSNFLLHTYRLQ